MIANSMIRAFHGARNNAGMDEDSFRDWLERDYGTRHISELSFSNARAALKALNGQASGRKPLAGPYAQKLQALWVSAWNLGIVRNRTDEAMLKFIERQTKIQRPEFLRDPKDASKAVEALKSWVAREGGVDWSAHDDPQDAVIAAQMRKLGIGPGDVSISGQGTREAVASMGKVGLMQWLGERVRRAK